MPSGFMLSVQYQQSKVYHQETIFSYFGAMKFDNKNIFLIFLLIQMFNIQLNYAVLQAGLSDYVIQLKQLEALENINDTLTDIKNMLTTGRRVGTSSMNFIPRNADMLKLSIENILEGGSSAQLNEAAAGGLWNEEELFDENGNPLICTKGTENQVSCKSPKFPTNCAEYNPAYCTQEMCRIRLKSIFKSFTVPCDRITDHGDWTIIQRRFNDSVDFNLSWKDYKEGFGNVEHGEYFMGLERLHFITTGSSPMELFVLMQDINNNTKFAKYDAFEIGYEREDYMLKNLGVYTGTAADLFRSSKGMKFSTIDRNNFGGPSTTCIINGGWWYPRNCVDSNLNGIFAANKNAYENLHWRNMPKIKYVQMMIRPVVPLTKYINHFLYDL